ncbi:Beta-agarase AgaB34 [Tetrabaena socialis]|uniref:Beta-agarase AgaB34 n=1 Tax=Tetrabaena socialis TaxID=47790 RepID=A0A2J7ZXI4_9CHLO|nr:Beta-agarase AgaB34 [Tetrabaena socialis]|eukprot:PNH04968.1 Beta-agarase AgaB34 [Tetrabaena socialis]
MPAPFEERAYTSCEVVKIVTYIGTVTIHGSVLEFGQDSVSDIFTEAGFLVQGTGRRRMLSGAYDLVGFFNFIKDLEIANLPPSEPKPHIAPIFEAHGAPNPNHPQSTQPPAVPDATHMRVRVYDECVDAMDRTLDRCIGPDGRDKPGTVVQEGVRFMTSYQTAARQHGLVMTAYEFPNAAPSLIRKELVNETSGAFYYWQDLMQGTRFTHCEYVNGTGSDLEAFRALSKDSIVSFSFVGYELKLGVATRHFRLVTRQAVLRTDGTTSPDGLPYDIKLVNTEFWDTSDDGDLCSISRNNYPVAFEMVHPLAGISKIHVVSFRANITQPDSVFALPSSFNDTDDPTGCPGPRFTNVPRLSDPFAPVWSAPPKDKLDSLFTTFTNITVTNDLGTNDLQGIVDASNSLDPDSLCTVGGCAVVKVGIDRLLRTFGWASSWKFPLSAEVMRLCLSYDWAAQQGALTGRANLPNVLLAWFEWDMRFETDFKDCLKLDTASVKVQYKSLCGWSFCTKTAWDRQLASGDGCPAVSTSTGARLVRLRNINSKCVDIPGGNQYNGNRLQLWDCVTVPNSQQFKVEPAGGAFSMKSTYGRGMDLDGWSTSNGARIQLWDFAGGNNQLWSVEDAGGGYSLIRSRHSGKCLDVQDGRSNNGAIVQQWSCNGGANSQRFKLEPW